MQPTQFDSTAWKAQRGMNQADMTRDGMLSKLEQVLQPGMSREDVLELLGPPDSASEDGSIHVYLLGIGMSPDPQYYELTYKDGALVSNKRLVH